MHDVFGSLEKHGDSYCGMVQFPHDRKISISIESDLMDPTDEELNTAVEFARTLFNRFDAEFERNARQEAAIQIIDAVFCQSDETIPPSAAATLSRQMILEAIEFFPGGALFVWRAAESFPDCSITAQITDDLEVEEVMVQE